MSDETKALATRQPTHIEIAGEMSVQAVVDRKRKMLEVLNGVMKEGEHYGKIPGCGDKPALFKGGAEILAMTFQLAPTFRIKRHDLAAGHREYIITCTLVHIASGVVAAEGVGSCSTLESKYRWRKADRKCPNCGQATIIKGKAEFGGGWICFAKKGGCGAKWLDDAAEIVGQETGRVENPDIADVYNTVLKMAKKRAQVDATLTAVGASDILAQDLEDLPPSSVDAGPATITPIAALRGRIAEKAAQLPAKGRDRALADATAATTIERLLQIEDAVDKAIAKARAASADDLPPEMGGQGVRTASAPEGRPAARPPEAAPLRTEVVPPKAAPVEDRPHGVAPPPSLSEMAWEDQPTPPSALDLVLEMIASAEDEDGLTIARKTMKSRGADLTAEDKAQAVAAFEARLAQITGGGAK